MITDLIQGIESRGEFVTAAGGFVYYATSPYGGILTSYELRAIADELDRRNEPWQKQIDAYFDSRTTDQPVSCVEFDDVHPTEERR